MTWNVEWDDRARRELHQLDRQVQRTILRYFSERIATDDDPRRFGRPLRHELQGLWRYRIGDYRAVCQIEFFCGLNVLRHQ
ncbi:MAG: type II toxin-antitoxin system RelE/ParE family toxin [Candidatus Thiodiazotropha endolucinida]|nr:type II toxin-antitoxin system RelE/ParE family toxin [Candidatus Thiodiazotropha taylori]MCW4225240.1 type II toxin-antitoxin system RelE/ParE family toxin [Candidatus Thiodiazotropha endolucinida]MCG7880792.1 type II toxin-antitoxin system RelE/ParE family toxin [Candidatus Thiodiazotropha taylori]MCG7886811.1 type II toxin-antitoxin system RelE/ParE family toxin [Candidatus Thiodiazotropha taylori]MCG8029108.1 type II toxin-antitoxin system RelE/ParE family toxin [Candidatus Thiodiazotrop